MKGIDHWLNMLSQIRNILSDADWDIRLDDLDIPWNTDAQCYDMKLL